MESAYLTVEFFRKLPLEGEKGGNPTAPNMDRYADNHLRRIGSNVLSYVNMVCDTLRNSIPKAAPNRSLLDHFYSQVGKKEKQQLGQMLDEDPTLMEKRQAIAKRLELYKAARDEIDAVAWK